MVRTVLMDSHTRSAQIERLEVVEMARKDPSPRSMVRFVGRVIKGSRPSKHPGFVEPALATLRAKPPSADKYIHEIKFDGYRVQAHLQGGLVSLWTRGGLDWTKRFPTIAVAIGSIPATGLILDGEVVAATEKGVAHFFALQESGLQFSPLVRFLIIRAM